MLKAFVAAAVASCTFVMPVQATVYTPRAVVSPVYSDGATSINSSGQIVYNSEGTTSCYIRSNEVSTRIPLSGTGQAGYDINDNGQVVGEQNYTAFTYQNGSTQSLASPYNRSVAYGINSTGNVVGYVDTGWSQQFPCIWQNGVYTRLDTLSSKSGIAHGINDKNQAVGWLEDVNRDEHAVIWENNVATQLAVPEGVLRSRAVGINNNGVICGNAIWGSKTHAVIWKNGVMIDLGSFGGVIASAYDVNDNGQVVGCSKSTSGYFQPFLWENGVLKQLPVLAGLHHGEAQSINNKGQIVGYCALQNGRSTAVMWEPVPEPSSILALISGIAGIGGLALKRRQ